MTEEDELDEQILKERVVRIIKMQEWAHSPPYPMFIASFAGSMEDPVMKMTSVAIDALFTKPEKEPLIKAWLSSFGVEFEFMTVAAAIDLEVATADKITPESVKTFVSGMEDDSLVQYEVPRHPYAIPPKKRQH